MNILNIFEIMDIELIRVNNILYQWDVPSLPSVRRYANPKNNIHNQGGSHPKRELAWARPDMSVCSGWRINKFKSPDLTASVQVPSFNGIDCNLFNSTVEKIDI